MRTNIFIGFFFAWALFITPAYASVVINEIAWMGTDVSSTNEWIELYNQDARAVDLSGWKIEATDGSPTIMLSGKISENGYFLIERTDDSTVAGVPADLIAVFGNGLSNSGETLRLLNGSGVVVDTVIGGVDWGNIGGNNISKETAQRTVNSWITGSATPRQKNIAQFGEVLGATTNSTSTNTTSTGGTLAQSNTTGGAGTGSKSASRVEVYPRKDIIVAAGDDKRGFTLFPLTFNGSSTGLYGESIDTATYRWNFGDGAIGVGKTVSHTYELPGEYVVTLEVFWSTYHHTDRLSVLVISPDVVISKIVIGDNGFIELANRTDREIDLSGWTIMGSAGKSSFVFPSNSVILAKKSFLLSNRVSHIGNLETNFSLYYPTGVIASSWGVPSSVLAQVTQVSTPQNNTIVPARPIVPVIANKKTYDAVNISAQSNAEKVGIVESGTNTEKILWKKEGSDQLGAGIAARGYEISGGLKWLLALFGIVLIVFAGFIIAKSHRGEVTMADEYAIIEDIIEGKDEVKT